MTPRAEHLTAAGVKDPAMWLESIQQTCDRFGINTPRQVAAFLAQTAHESAGYTQLSENLNYSAEGMAGIWPTRFAELGADKKPKKDAKGKNIPNAFARALHRKPEAIANVVYGGRMGNGPIESGDGWRHRGMGLKQLTGKENQRRCGEALGVDLVAQPELLLTPKYAALSAGWFWADKKCGPLADADDFVGLTRRINGATIGIEDRTRRYRAVLAVMEKDVA